MRVQGGRPRCRALPEEPALHCTALHCSTTPSPLLPSCVPSACVCCSNSPGGVNFESAPFKLTRELLEVMDSNSEGKASELFDYFKVM